MAAPKIFEMEYKFCLILWENEPIRSRELAALCRERLGWKPSTTYTVIRRLSDRGVIQNEHMTVTSLVSKEEAQASEIDEFVEEKFAGSLPAFFAAFSRRQKLTDAELDEIQKMIDRARQEGGE